MFWLFFLFRCFTVWCRPFNPANQTIQTCPCGLRWSWGNRSSDRSTRLPYTLNSSPKTNILHSSPKFQNPSSKYKVWGHTVEHSVRPADRALRRAAPRQCALLCIALSFSSGPALPGRLQTLPASMEIKDKRWDRRPAVPANYGGFRGAGSPWR